MRCLLFVGMPIFVSIVAVAKFSGVDDPKEPIFASGTRGKAGP